MAHDVSRKFFGYAAICLLTAALGAADLAAQSASVTLSVTDAAKEWLPCRVHLHNANGEPQRAADLPFFRDHFSCLGTAKIDLAPGTYSWEIERGPEFESHSGTLEVKAGQPQRLDVSLNRISNLRENGWYSGDLHVHRPSSDIETLMLAEDLDFAPVVQWWNQRNTSSVQADTTIKRFDRNRIYELLAGEDEREGGALLYFGLKRPLDLNVQSREVPSPMQFVQQARTFDKDTWIDIEKPFWWDVPTWLASGQMNSIGLANNHMCRRQMLANEAWGKPRDAQRLPAPRGNGFWTQEIYYHILNSGLRIPPSAGSASGVLPNPVGYNRVYVQLGDQPFTRDNWFRGLAEGKCFVTNGPLLSVTANGQHAGRVFQPKDGQPLKIDLQIALTSKDSLSRLEIIHNGRIVKQLPCGPSRSQRWDTSLEIDRPGWFLVRAIADVDHTFRFASTAPWYVESSTGSTYISKRSTQFFLDWVTERTERIRSAVADDGDREAVLKPHRQAQAFWKERLALAAPEDSDPPSSRIETTSLTLTELPIVDEVESQPLISATKRLVDAMQSLGSPLPAPVVRSLESLSSLDDTRTTTARVQEVLDPLCLASVSVTPSGPPRVTMTRHRHELMEQGWRTFLIKVINPSQRKGRLRIESPNSNPLPHAPADQIQSRWMQLSSFEGRPLKPDLSGLELEYRIVQIYSRDPGSKKAILEFAVTGGRSDDDLIRSWRFDKGVDQWFPMHHIEIEAKEQSLHVVSTGNDPYMGSPVQAPAGPKLIRFWGKADADGMGQLFWWTKDRPNPSGDRRINFLVEAGKEHLYEIPFTAESELAGIRIDPLSKPGSFRIDWIDLHTASRSEQWNKVTAEFQCVAATPVTLHVYDRHGKPAMATFEITDQDGRIYPAQSKRLAPDFFFHRQIYRGDGETVALPPGEYTITCSRGPETIPETKTLTVGDEPTELTYRINRWIDPSQLGWWSGDHHIHAAGCRHYENPTQGVEPADMIRHIMGEDLKVGCCLTWGPCFDYQKRFFTGEVAEQSQYPYTLRYDVEVSGFGSHMSGHLNLLNLTEQIYPGGESKDHWPTLGLNTLRWAKRQGAICGPAHSAIGLTRTIGRLPGTVTDDGPENLPNFDVPTYDGIGANEFVVDVTHRVPGPDGKPIQAIDFISTMNTQRVAEWNMWYHVLNCGFRVAASGETDFPCVSGERVGLGRVYAHVDGELTFAKWVQSLGKGRSYVSDGECHLLNFRAQNVSSETSTKPAGAGDELRVSEPGTIRFSAICAARKPGSPELDVELIVNGYPAAKRRVRADGSTQSIEFDLPLQRSSWVALRAFPHAHTNPVYVVIGDQGIRGTVDSARWCLAGVEQCWKSKRQTYADAEQADAVAAYQHARETYQQLIDSWPAQ